ncbi:MAG TPA: bifunctional phosphoribosylaminoimidazolecarboxamide formyltransferase/IMP cyclohydrolase [Clostridia bacterium]|nr:bifunctional phosphoribosylaminoimidazolecarboxamide formyltransferase/IMP cyclohydrolase [Clostridia bacterium]
MKRAIISVSDKTGVVEFAKGLAELGYEIISTGGTGKAIEAEGIKVINISEITGYPECLDGRVKTLHPKIHGGLLAIRNNPEHMSQIEKLEIKPIDIVAVNLYPFKKTILKDGVTLEEAIENIDIGGPTMIRAAAKNWQDVAVIVDPDDYNAVLDELRQYGEVSKETKFRLCCKVFSHTAVYDTLIASYLNSKLGDIGFPQEISFAYEKVQEMRYGENPHQKAAFYREVGKRPGSIVEAEKLHGKELSFNNINDANAAIELLKEFDETAVVAVKHANPCGVASAASLYEAYKRAYDCDPVSIFGGIVAANAEIDAATALEMSKIFLEIIIAPSYSHEALEILTRKKNLRLLKMPDIRTRKITGMDMKKVNGGILIQDYDTTVVDKDSLQYVTKRKPTEAELADMLFGMKVVKHVKSNAIVFVKDKATVGIGVGQVNRIWAAQQAIEHGGERIAGSVMASDAFFPFPDCVEAAAKAGVTAVIHPGGAKGDQDSIDEADKNNMAMVITGIRHFKH